MLETLERLDQDLTLTINRLSSGTADYIWQLFSNTQVWFPLYIFIGYLLFKQLGWKKASVVLSFVVLTILACDQAANLFKDGFERLRPCYDSYMVQGGVHILERRTGFYGFFSAHSANAFGLAMCTSLTLRDTKSHRNSLYRWLIFMWATLVAASRIFAGKHFLGDVLVGTAAGLLIGWFFAILARQLTSRL